MKPKKFFASVPTVKKIDEDARTIEHIISTGSEDRDGDTINPKGWILDEFLKNPVVLFGHRHDMPPIARAVKLKAGENGLETLTLFPPKGISQLSDTAFDLNRLDFIRSWSVGFDPVTFTVRDNGGTAFEEQKLLEYSSVPVPANPDAVNLAVSKGVMTEKMLKVFQWQKGGFAVGPGVGPCVIPFCLEHTSSPTTKESIARILAEEAEEEFDIDIKKLQSWFEEGNAALQISGAHHARILRPGKTIRA